MSDDDDSLIELRKKQSTHNQDLHPSLHSSCDGGDEEGVPSDPNDGQQQPHVGWNGERRPGQ